MLLPLVPLRVPAEDRFSGNLVFWQGEPDALLRIERLFLHLKSGKFGSLPRDLNHRSRWLIAIAVAGCWATSPGRASSVVSVRFDDWELVCPQHDGTDSNDPSARRATVGNTGAEYEADKTLSSSPLLTDRSCRLQQAQAVNGGKDVVFLFNVVMQKHKPIAIISTPLNVYLPAGLELSIDGGSIRRAVFETCNATGCHAGFALERTLLSNLRRGNELRVTMRNSKATQVPVSVPLKGISAGLKALAEKNGPDRNPR